MSPGTEFQRHQFLHTKNVHPLGGRIEFAPGDLERSLPARFKKIVDLCPERLAVKSNAGELTYRALDDSVNRLADVIVERYGSKPEPVGILAQHGIPTMVAMLAVLKARKFYVPLDPQYPNDRLEYMLGDTNAAVVVTDSRHLARASQLLGGQMATVNLDDIPAQRPKSRSDLSIAPDDICGIYYTSGTTGRPKGVVYTHRYLLHNLMNYGTMSQISSHDRWTWLHSCSFSTTATDVFCPLLHGASVCHWNVPEEGLARLADWLTDAGATILHWLASPLRSFAGTLDPARKFPNVRLVILGGEKLFARDARTFFDLFSPDCLFINRLGLTESGHFRNYLFDRETPLPEGVVPAGYSVPGKKAVILDSHGIELAAGEIGEIGVRSRYFPPGYWQRPEITREKFLDDEDGSGMRLYLTGDLGRLRADGCLEYHGRKDSQVKIRGHRVEIEEIEKVIRELSGVREAVVTAREGPTGETILAGYFVPVPAAPVDVAAVRRHLLGKLPAHMVPLAFVKLDHLPLSASGKPDLAALPVPKLKPELPTERYLPPRTTLEELLVELWQSVLELAPIGIEDDFFELGGDSLKGMRMVNLIQGLINTMLHVPPLFENPTIATYARFLESNYGDEIRKQLFEDGEPQEDLAPNDVCGEQKALAALSPEKLQLVRDAIDAFPIATGAAAPRERKNPSAIFVLAPARSGTTLLRVILGGHPLLFAPPELHLLAHATMQERRADISERLQRDRLDAALRALMTARNCPLDEAERVIDGYEKTRLPVDEFYRELQSLIAPRRLVDKTPMYTWRLEILQRAEDLFDQPLYVHLLRHPYGTILSYEEGRMDQLALIRRPSGVSLTEFAEALWLISQQTIVDFLAKIPQRRQMRLSFEDLVKQPRENIAALCRFLDLDLHPGMLDPYEEQERRMTDQIRPLVLPAGDPKFQQHKEINSTVADRWREVYRDDFLCSETWRMAELLGYLRTHDAASSN